MPQQPKFKDCIYDSSKDHPPHVFRTWLTVLGGIVSNYPTGPCLEKFLQLFLGWNANIVVTAPSFLKDPRLYAPGTTPSIPHQGRQGTTHRHGPPAPTSSAGPLGGPTPTTPGGNSTSNLENEEEEDEHVRATQEEVDALIREAQEQVRAQKDYEDEQTTADAGSPRTKVTTASQ